MFTVRDTDDYMKTHLLVSSQPEAPEFNHSLVAALLECRSEVIYLNASEHLILKVSQFETTSVPLRLNHSLHIF